MTHGLPEHEVNPDAAVVVRDVVLPHDLLECLHSVDVQVEEGEERDHRAEQGVEVDIVEPARNEIEMKSYHKMILVLSTNLGSSQKSRSHKIKKVLTLLSKQG